MRRLTFVLFPALVAIQPVVVPRFVVPNFTDLTIKTRQTFGELPSTDTIQVEYLKGPRERRELIVDGPRAGDRHLIVIYQCDKRRTLELNADAKIYGASPFEDWSEHLARLRPVAEPDGTDVTIATDAVDTGERRRVGGHLARRVRTRVTVEPAPGANTRPRTEETDGWYLDLPGIGCANGGAVAAAYLSGEVVQKGGVRDRLHFKTLGNAPRGYPIEETDRQTEGVFAPRSGSSSSLTSPRCRSTRRCSSCRPATGRRCRGCVAGSI
jgi:hypothetical protein